MWKWRMFPTVQLLLFPLMSIDSSCIILGRRISHSQQNIAVDNTCKCLCNRCFLSRATSPCVSCMWTSRRVSVSTYRRQFWYHLRLLLVLLRPVDGPSNLHQLFVAIVIGYVVAEGTILIWAIRVWCWMCWCVTELFVLSVIIVWTFHSMPSWTCFAVRCWS